MDRHKMKIIMTFTNLLKILIYDTLKGSKKEDKW